MGFWGDAELGLTMFSFNPRKQKKMEYDHKLAFICTVVDTQVGHPYDFIASIVALFQRQTQSSVKGEIGWGKQHFMLQNLESQTSRSMCFIDNACGDLMLE